MLEAGRLESLEAQKLNVLLASQHSGFLAPPPIALDIQSAIEILHLKKPPRNHRWFLHDFLGLTLSSIRVLL